MEGQAQQSLFAEPETQSAPPPPPAAEARGEKSAGDAHAPEPAPQTPRPTRPRKKKPDDGPRLPTEDEIRLRQKFEADREGFIDAVVLSVAKGMFSSVDASYHMRQLRDFGATDEGAASEFGTSFSMGTLNLSVAAGKSPFIKAENSTGLFFTLEAAEFGARLRRLAPFPEPVTADERRAVLERRMAEAKARLVKEGPEMVNRILGLNCVKAPPRPAGTRSKKSAGAGELFGGPERTPAEEVAARLYEFALNTPEGERAACDFTLEVLTRRGVSTDRHSRLLRAVGHMIDHARIVYASELTRAGLIEAGRSE